MGRVLGINVDDALLRAWTSWLAPVVQPLFVTHAVDWPSCAPAEVTPELRDTYALWRLERPVEVVWLDEPTFMSLTRPQRSALVREQVRRRRGAVPTLRTFADALDVDVRGHADGHRFVWWPSLVTERALARLMAHDMPSSRHTDVTAKTWRNCERLVPGVRALAGTFRPPGSEANCFATTMSAAGMPDTADAWIEREPFEDWLAAATVRGGDDDAPGTVLVWRDPDGLAQHSAVTIGDGWAFEKASQEWWTPRLVLPARELIRNNRTPGRRLERRRIVR